MLQLTRKKIFRKPKKRKLIDGVFYNNISDQSLELFYIEILEFMYPRLLKFRDMVGNGKPCGVESREDWIIILDEILWFISNMLKTRIFSPYNENDWYRFNEAHLLFHRYFFELQL